MIKYVATTDLTQAKVWYIIDDNGGKLYIPALVLSQNGPLVRLACLTRLLLTPELNLNNPEDQERIEWRTMTPAPGDPKHVRRADPNTERRTSRRTESFL
jgi:hypothetical protein